MNAIGEIIGIKALTLFSSLFCSFNFCKSLELSIRLFSSAIALFRSFDGRAMTSSCFLSCLNSPSIGGKDPFLSIASASSIMFGMSGNELRLCVRPPTAVFDSFCIFLLISRFRDSSRLRRIRLRNCDMQIIKWRLRFDLFEQLRPHCEHRKFVAGDIFKSVENEIETLID